MAIPPIEKQQQAASVRFPSTVDETRERGRNSRSSVLREHRSVDWCVLRTWRRRRVAVVFRTPTPPGHMQRQSGPRVSFTWTRMHAQSRPTQHTRPGRSRSLQQTSCLKVIATTCRMAGAGRPGLALGTMDRRVEIVPTRCIYRRTCSVTHTHPGRAGRVCMRRPGSAVRYTGNENGTWTPEQARLPPRTSPCR